MSSLELKTTIDKVLSDIVGLGGGTQDLQNQIDDITNDLYPANEPLKYVKTNSLGKIDASLMPAGIDDVLCYPTYNDFPVTGEDCKIYQAEDQPLKTWRWSGLAYIDVSGGVSSVNGEVGLVSLSTDSIPVANDKNYISSANITAIGTNTADIATNTTNIANNVLNITTNTANIVSNTANIATNSANIATNSANIATNSANIVTNTANIGTLQTLTLGHTTSINTNTSNISANNTLITTNTTDIATNVASINAINTDLLTINSDIAQNELDIASNLTAIGVNTANITGNTNSITTINTSKGQANGICPLDGGGKIDAQYIGAIYVPKGNWDVSTNTPVLSDATGVNGWVYRVSVGGSIDLGSGILSFNTGDFAIHNGTIYQKSDNTESINSVNTKIGAVVINSDDISDVGYTNKWATQSQLNQIATNTSNITTANTNIATNVTDINALTSVVGSLTTADVSDAGQVNKYATSAQLTAIATNTSNITALDTRVTTAETDITTIENDANIARFSNGPTNDTLNFNVLKNKTGATKVDLSLAVDIKTNVSVLDTFVLEMGKSFIGKMANAGNIQYTENALQLTGAGTQAGRIVRINEYLTTTLAHIITNTTEAIINSSPPFNETTPPTGTTIWDTNNNAITVRNGAVWEEVLTDANLLNKVTLTTASVAPSTNRQYLTDTEDAFINPTNYNTVSNLVQLDADTRVPRGLMPRCRITLLSTNNGWFKLSDNVTDIHFTPDVQGSSHFIINPFGEVTLNIDALISTQPTAPAGYFLYINLPIGRNLTANTGSSGGAPCGFLQDRNRPCFMESEGANRMAFYRDDAGYAQITQADLLRDFFCKFNYTYLSSEVAPITV